MNVAQELSDRELYDYDVLVKLLGDRFDPASRVSASRSRFHGRTRHQEDADTYADSITELCRLGYPQSSPELRQELISEQFVWGQSDPELKKYMWVVIRTQKDRKLQTLIEVCTYFASLSHTTNVHRPAEQVLALEEDDDREEEMFAGAATNVRPRASHGIRDVTDRSPFRRPLECNPAKIEDVKSWPVHQFLGFVRYHRQFIPSFADVATPLVT